MPNPLLGGKGPGPELSAAVAADANGRRRIVWILPRAKDVAFEYLKRCESCSNYHSGQYGSGRFCSSRCARRVGGLAKKRKWDLTHGVPVLDTQKDAEETSPSAGSTATSSNAPLSSTPIRSDDVALRTLRSNVVQLKKLPAPPPPRLGMFRMEGTTPHWQTMNRTLPPIESDAKSVKKRRVDSEFSKRKMSLAAILNPEP